MPSSTLRHVTAPDQLLERSESDLAPRWNRAELAMIRMIGMIGRMAECPLRSARIWLLLQSHFERLGLYGVTWEDVMLAQDAVTREDRQANGRLAVTR